MMDKPSVFISHAPSDDEWVRRFSKEMENRGLSVWLDLTALRAGDDLREGIEKGLRESDAVIAVVTQDNIRSPSLLFEIGAAVGMGKRVIAIVPPNFDLSLVPQPLRTRKFLVRGSPEETADALANATSESIA